MLHINTSSIDSVLVVASFHSLIQSVWILFASLPCDKRKRLISTQPPTFFITLLSQHQIVRACHMSVCECCVCSCVFVWRHCFLVVSSMLHCDPVGWGWYYELEEASVLFCHPVSLSVVVNVGWS